ncbi:MAG: DUF4258 domain-containing protein [Bacteriovoracia bacterium]
MVDVGSRIDVTSMLSSGQARKVLSEIFNQNPNLISFSKHALEEMKNDNLKTGDILNVLKAGKIYDAPEFENGSYRYRIQTQKITVVIAFRKPNHVVIVTAWRE